MEITVSVRHGEVAEETKSYARNELSGILDTHHKITSAKIILDMQGRRAKSEILVNMKNTTIEADEETFDMKKSIDTTIDKIDIQVGKHFDKLQNHRKTQIVADNKDEADNDFGYIDD